jgi:hypothetical protein
MTLPPHSDQPQYPRQDLLPQQVQPGRSRLPLVIAAAALVVALVGALVVWWVVHDDGEQNRAAYCSALRDLTRNGNGSLLQTAGSAGAGVPAALGRLRDLAPSAVENQWDDLVSVVQSMPDGQPDVGQIARALTDLQAIIADADSGCGLKLQFPG